MIFLQPLFDNFWNNILSHIHVCFYSLSSSFSLHCFCPITRGENWLSLKLSNISCTNITPPKVWQRLQQHFTMWNNVKLVFFLVYANRIGTSSAFLKIYNFNCNTFVLFYFGLNALFTPYVSKSYDFGPLLKKWIF